MLVPEEYKYLPFILELGNKNMCSRAAHTLSFK